MKKSSLLKTVVAIGSAAILLSVSLSVHADSHPTYVLKKATAKNNSKDSIVLWQQMDANAALNFTNIGDSPLGKEWQKETGVKIKFEHPSAGQAKEQFNLLVADGNLPDIMKYDWIGYPGGPEKAIQDKVILPLNDIIDKYCPNLKKYLKEHPETDRMVKTDNGHYYTFPFLREEGGDCYFVGLSVRKDWLDDLGLAVPQTIDEWHTALKAFKEKKGATAPLTGVLRYKEYNPFAFAFNTCSTFFIGNDKKVHYGPYDNNYKDYLETMRVWYKEGLLDKDFASLPSEQIDAKMTDGESGVSFGYPGSSMGVWMNSARAKNPTYQLKAAPVPQVKKGVAPQMGQVDNPFNGNIGYSITTSCKNVKTAAKLLDYGYGEKGHMMFNFGIEGESYEMKDNYPTYTDMIFKNPKGWSLAESMSAYSFGNSDGPFVKDGRDDEQYFQLDCQKEAAKIWGVPDAKKHKLPPITPTIKESKNFSSMMTEISTYVDEMSLKFILGNKKIGEFKDFQKELKNMGMEKVLKIQNSALKRYYKR